MNRSQSDGVLETNVTEVARDVLYAPSMETPIAPHPYTNQLWTTLFGGTTLDSAGCSKLCFVLRGVTLFVRASYAGLTPYAGRVPVGRHT